MNRLRLPGQTRFFTLHLAAGQGDLLTARIADLREAWRLTVAELPTRCEAMVVLPDHLHAVLTLPPGAQPATARWRRFRTGFAEALGRAPEEIWAPEILTQPLETEAEINRALALCWHDPVHHGLAPRPEDWPYSSLHRDMRQAARRRAVA